MVRIGMPFDFIANGTLIWLSDEGGGTDYVPPFPPIMSYPIQHPLSWSRVSGHMCNLAICFVVDVIRGVLNTPRLHIWPITLDNR